MIVERWQDGVLVESWDDGVTVPDHVPLDPHGQLVTLLVVVGALSLDDAEHVAGPDITADDLVAEAEAWSLAP